MSKKYFKFLLFLLFIFLGTIVTASPKIVHVKHYQVECFSELVSLCYYIKDFNVSLDWHTLYTGIDGFDYQWGYDTLLYVEETERDKLHQDISPFKYKLIEQISKTRNNNAFTVQLSVSRSDGESYLSKKTNSIYSIHSQKDLHCEEDDCKKLDYLILKKHWMLLSLNTNEDPLEPLNLLKIICSGAQFSSMDKCYNTKGKLHHD